MVMHILIPRLQPRPGRSRSTSRGRRSELGASRYRLSTCDAGCLNLALCRGLALAIDNGRLRAAVLAAEVALHVPTSGTDLRREPPSGT